MTFPLPIDHARYLDDRRYRRSAHFALRKAARKAGLYKIPANHDEGGRCCLRESWDDTQARIIRALQDDGAPFLGPIYPSRAERLLARVKHAPGVARPGGRLDRILSTLMLRAIEGGTCPHLATTPCIALVQLHNPRLLCPSCFERAAQELRGTPEDGTCDVCRREVDELRRVLIDLIPGDVAQLAPEYLLLATGGLCTPCFQAEMLVGQDLEVGHD